MIAAALSIGGLASAGCADDPVQPGTITARYTLFPKTCSDLRLAEIRAQARRADGSIENESTVACETQGEVTVSALPGVYNVVIDGLSDEPTPRATHSARQDGVRVADGGTATTNELLLTQKPGSVHVRWSFSDSLQCVDNDVSQVEVKLLDSGNNTIGEAQTVPCLNTFIDPEDQAEKSGVLFETVQIQDQTAFDVVVRGFDSGGSTIRVGTAEDQTLPAGQRNTIDVQLAPSP